MSKENRRGGGGGFLQDYNSLGAILSDSPMQQFENKVTETLLFHQPWGAYRFLSFRTSGTCCGRSSHRWDL